MLPKFMFNCVLHDTFSTLNYYRHKSDDTVLYTFRLLLNEYFCCVFI